MYPNSIRFFKEYLRDHRKEYVIGISTLLITAFATCAIPTFISQCTDLIAAAEKINASQTYLDSDTKNQLITPAVIIIILGLTQAIARTLSRVFIFLPGRRIEAQVRQDLFDAVVSLPPDAINNFKSGDLISRGTNDISSIRVMISMGVLHTINSSCMLILCLSLMLKTNTILTLICLAPVPITVLITRFFSKRMMIKSRLTQAKLGDLSEGVREQFRAHSLLAIFPVFAIIHKKFASKNNSYRQAAEALMSNRVFMVSTILLTNSLALFLLLWFGGREALQGDSFTVGNLVAFIFYLGMLQGPLQALGWLLPILQRGEVCLERVYQIRDTSAAASQKEEQKEHKSFTSINRQSDDKFIEIKDLKFTYPGDKQNHFELNVDQLEIEKGKSYGVFGTTGSGKSTLAMLLSGNLSPTSGEIYFNGLPYSEIHQDFISRIFSLVPQECRHFSGELKANLKSPDYDERDSKAKVHDFERAYEISQMKNDINQFPDQFNSLIGENGLNLSGGQRQRLAIFRALLKPRQALIMDDFVSAIDHTTEEALLRELNRDKKGETCLLISHRVSALMECDQILIMEEGRICRQGTHAELVKSYAPYRKIFEYQLLESELEDMA